MNESNMSNEDTVKNTDVSTEHMKQGLSKHVVINALNFYQKLKLIVIEDGSDDFLMKQYIDDLFDGPVTVKNPLIIKHDALELLLELKPLIMKCVTLEQTLLQVIHEKDYFKNVIKNIPIDERANSQRNYRIHTVKLEIIESFNVVRDRIINLLEYINSIEYYMLKN